MDAGYWQTKYWPDSYWPTDYWPEYGEGSALIPRYWVLIEAKPPEIAFVRKPVRIGFHTDDSVRFNDKSPEIDFKRK